MSSRSLPIQPPLPATRIGIFLDEWTDGGVPVFLERLERYLTTQGHEVVFFLARPHPKRDMLSRCLYLAMKKRLGERCALLDLDSMPRSWRSAHFQQAVVSRRIACLFVNHFYHHLEQLQTFAAEVPMISIAHADADHYYYEYLRSRELTRAQVAVSQRIHEKLLSFTSPEYAKRINYIPYGVEDPARRFQSAPSGPMRVVYSARLEPVQKRCDDLLPIWKKYVADGGRGELVILGTGKYEKVLRQGFREELASGAVTMRGQLPVDEALDEMARADVLLNLSNFEGLPQVALEGATLGLHLLLSDIESGHREIVELLKAGTLCHVGDVRGFARELGQLERNLESVRAKRNEGRRRALEHYAFPQCGQKYLEMIKAVSSAKPVIRQADSPKRSPGEWIDRAHRLIRYRRHFKP